MLTHGHPNVRSALDEAGYLHAVVGQDRLLPVSAGDAQGRPRHCLQENGTVHGQVLTYGPDSGLGRLLRELKGQAYARLSAQASMAAQLASVLRTMALDGLGMAWLPEILIKEDLLAGRLVQAGPAEWELELQVRLYRGRGLVGSSCEQLWQAVAPDQ